MAFIVLPNQQLLGDWLIENTFQELKAGRMPPMLGPARADTDPRAGV